MTSKVTGIVAAAQVCIAVGEAIRDITALKGGVPSGEVYAHLLGKLTIDEYDAIIDLLKRAKLVAETNHYLVWIGPPKQEGDIVGTSKPQADNS